jgi:hypothetical protein
VEAEPPDVQERDHVVIIVPAPWSRHRHCPHIQLVEEALPLDEEEGAMEEENAIAVAVYVLCFSVPSRVERELVVEREPQQEERKGRCRAACVEGRKFFSVRPEAAAIKASGCP